ncbi:hypothetical protein RMATCC62417_17991 [Rhizopus microsporus]|nr:hypothetical protein RMATCC62417_17991 [Rhizopus microsporus]
MKKKRDLQSIIKEASYEPIQYSIHDYSSHSGTYYPQNITVNNPTEQSSRWSSGSHDQSQYITLKLEKPVIACEILFGKFHRSHVCNLKEFKIFGGMDLDNLNELLHDGLTNDNEAEVFPLRYTYDDLVFPVQYIRISPIATFGRSFNYSIWYVEIRGIKKNSILSLVFDAYIKYKELETIKLCLKHFRQKNMMDLYHLLKEKTGVEFEHPLISNLHQALVIDGDFDEAERIIDNAEASSIFDHYVQTAKYSLLWQEIYASNSDGDTPCPRGGHQMCIDVDGGKIYLFGGWDGSKDLSDFWCYNIEKQRWKLLSSDTLADGGPSARSCHQICFDPTKKSIFVLGRYIEPSTNTTIADLTGNTYGSDFYQYFIELDQWIKISDNTQIDGGPPLLYDLQMCVDPVDRILYVSGGRIAAPGSTSYAYGGLYAYDMIASSWETLRHDEITQGARSPHSPDEAYLARWAPGNRSPLPIQTIKGRAGHSMAIHAEKRGIYIFAGQRERSHLSDLYYYSIDEKKINNVVENFFKGDGSDIGYTQRATIDEDLKELYVFTAYVNGMPSNTVKNLIWVYSIEKNHWEKLYENESQDSCSSKCIEGIEPTPRFAHQVVYNSKTKAHYIFGGNPGDHKNEHRRLNDFWELKLTKPTSAQIVRKCIYLIRARKLYEMCDKKLHINGERLELNSNMRKDTIDALNYLRNYILPLVDHENREEVAQFKQLCSHLCVPTYGKNDGNREMQTEDFIFASRTKVFQNLLEYFPRNMKEPNGSVMDSVKIL